MSRTSELVSADSHVLEPPDVPPAPIGIYASAGRAHEDVRWTGVTFAEANRGNFRRVPMDERRRICARNAAALYGLP